MTDCIFCRIAAGEMGTEFLYQDDLVVVFKDVRPRTPVHLLVVPRKHIPSLNEVVAEDEPLLGRILRAAGQVARETGIAEKGYRVIGNTGPYSGQEVNHVHFHVLGGRPLGRMVGS